MTKEQFLLNEILTLTLLGGLSTRNSEYPIYKKLGTKDADRNNLKKDLRNELLAVYEKYKEKDIKDISENELLIFIEQLSKRITEKHAPILQGDRFRIGISQKIINLFLKYLWVLGWLGKPPHCPFDAIIKKELNKPNLTDWTTLDEIDEYREYVKAAFQIAGKNGKTIAEWELENWNPS